MIEHDEVREVRCRIKQVVEATGWGGERSGGWVCRGGGGMTIGGGEARVDRDRIPSTKNAIPAETRKREHKRLVYCTGSIEGGGGTISKFRSRQQENVSHAGEKKMPRCQRGVW